MDGITITLIAGLYGSMFTLYYKLGRVEERLKALEDLISNGGCDEETTLACKK